MPDREALIHLLGPSQAELQVPLILQSSKLSSPGSPSLQVPPPVGGSAHP